MKMTMKMYLLIKKNTGFVGTAFQNGNDIIISYTGSEGLDVTLDKYGNISCNKLWRFHQLV